MIKKKNRNAIQILLREDFKEEDYYEFIKEGKNTIIKAIEEIILNKREGEEINYTELIEKGECNELEFKTTFNYNLNLRKIDKTMKLVVIKAITGFLNTSGGACQVFSDIRVSILAILSIQYSPTIIPQS